MKELKPCPFCGGEAKLTKGITYLDNYVTCCECFSRTKTYNTKESAIKSWNKRNAWIPCSEKLPEYNELVIVCNIYGEIEMMRLFEDVEMHEDVWLNVFENPYYNIIAWQPLPPKYEE